MVIINGPMENLIFEKVEVIAYFHNLNCEILKFKWKDDVYAVSKMHSHWKIPAGSSFELHYTVTCDKQNIICELSFDLNDLRWELIQLDCYN